MEALPWFWIWLILAALLYVGEMLTTSFFLLPFAVGATVAFIANLLGLSMWIEWGLFIVVSVLMLVIARPIFKRVTMGAEKVTAGVDRLIGLTGSVIEGRSPSGENRVQVLSEVWNVSTSNGEILPVGSRVRVLQIDGAHLVVERV